MTDNTILEMSMTLAQRRSSEGPSKRSLDTRRVQGQLELVQRLQKPKLLSDMRAFKAANPGALFQDFWYCYHCCELVGSYETQQGVRGYPDYRCNARLLVN